jgi:hypothetical protein
MVRRREAVGEKKGDYFGILLTFLGDVCLSPLHGSGSEAIRKEILRQAHGFRRETQVSQIGNYIPWGSLGGETMQACVLHMSCINLGLSKVLEFIGQARKNT